MVTAVVWLLLAGAPLAARKQCTPAETEAAEKGLDQLKDWAHVQDAFRAFAHCDDGAIAEGYSDKIMQLLARQWSTIPDLDKRIRVDPSFRAFVLRHIDETWVSAEFELVMGNAANRCPSSARSLCAAIMRRGSEVAHGTKTP